MVERGNFNRENLDLFWTFVYERHAIWNRRFIQNLPAPWTKDPILQKNKFTNIYRELDPGTQFCRREILEMDAPKPDRVFNVMIYRLICSIPTYQALGFQDLDRFNVTEFQAVLSKIERSGKQVFGNAYIISPYSSMGSSFKYVNVARLFHQLHQDFRQFWVELASQPSLNSAFHIVNSKYGFGPFLAYQVCVDLMYPTWQDEGESILPFHHDDWAKLGPGALRGFGRLVHQKPYVDPLAGLRWLRWNQREEFERLGLAFPFWLDEEGGETEISLSNMQNCLCEFHKYGSTREGVGKAQRLFVPSSKTPFAPR